MRTGNSAHSAGTSRSLLPSPRCHHPALGFCEPDSFAPSRVRGAARRPLVYVGPHGARLSVTLKPPDASPSRCGLCLPSQGASRVCLGPDTHPCPAPALSPCWRCRARGCGPLRRPGSPLLEFRVRKWKKQQHRVPGARPGLSQEPPPRSLQPLRPRTLPGSVPARRGAARSGALTHRRRTQ